MIKLSTLSSEKQQEANGSSNPSSEFGISGGSEQINVKESSNSKTSSDPSVDSIPSEGISGRHETFE